MNLSNQINGHSPKRYAIEHARAGFPVIRVAKGSKRPTDTDWVLQPYTDPEKVAKDFLSDGNYGVRTGCGLIVIDVDAHKGGSAQLEDLVRRLGPLPVTRRVRTPNGGFHLYFKTPPALNYSNAPLAPAVDVRATGGQAVGPGSIVDGKRYELERACEPVELPERWLERLANNIECSRDGDTAPTMLSEDTASGIAAAIDYLQNAAPLAIEGSHGDDTTIKVANRVMDFVSEDMTFELMRDHWNDKCLPPWDDDELESKVRSAAKSRQSPIGLDDPGNGFEVVEPSSTGIALTPSIGLRKQKWADDPENNREVDWLVDDLFPKVGTALLVGASGAGKTFLAVHLTKCMEWGFPFFGREISDRGGAYFIPAEGENSLQLRLDASRVGMFSECRIEGKPAGTPVRWCATVPDLLSKAGVAHLIADLKLTSSAMIERFGVPLRLVVIDTLAQAFAIEDENKATEMRRATAAMATIAQECSVLVLTLHHFGKDETKGARGSTALRANVDAMLYALKGHILTAAKVREGPEGELGRYHMPILDLGLNKKGKPITSRFIDVIETRTQGIASGFDAAADTADHQNKSVTKRSNPNDTIFSKSFAAACRGSSYASKDAIRQEFYNAHNGRRDTKQRAYLRTLQRAIEHLGYREDGERLHLPSD